MNYQGALPRLASVLRSGDMLLHTDAEDQHVEGGAWLGGSPDIRICAVVSLGDGGPPDSSSGAEETEP